MLKDAFLFAHEFVVVHGFSDEIDWQNSVSLRGLDEPRFLREYAWVVLTCGMREAVVRKRFPSISECFCSWRSAQDITSNAEACVRAAMRVFRHEGKIRAIAWTATRVAQEGFPEFRERLMTSPLKTLQALPYIGQVTKYHLAKNIGLDVAKPDRHLVRISRLFGYPTAQEFCEAIAAEAGTKVAIADLVFWRFATLHRNYLEALGHFA